METIIVGSCVLGFWRTIGFLRKVLMIMGSEVRFEGLSIVRVLRIIESISVSCCLGRHSISVIRGSSLLAFARVFTFEELEAFSGLGEVLLSVVILKLSELGSRFWGLISHVLLRRIGWRGPKDLWFLITRLLRIIGILISITVLVVV